MSQNTASKFTEELLQFSNPNIKLTKCKKFYSAVKRVIDLIFALVLSVILLIPCVLISIIILIDSRGPIFFKQYRVGKDGKLFYIYKFRTMTVDKKIDAQTGEHIDQVTKVGKVLRRTSIDEIPQLINIIKGEMSFVGPRPLVMKEGEIHKLRMEKGVYLLQPGITGLAQISGRDVITDECKAALDEQYLKEFGFATDLKLVFKTIPKTLSSEDVVEGSHTQSY